MTDTLNPMDLPGSPDLPLTVSPADTSLDSPEPEGDLDDMEIKEEDKKPTKKRKSWGQELPTPKTNLPPRKRAKTDDEKEQRRIERVLRNRAAAQTSRERKRLEMEKLETEKIRMEEQNQFLLQRLTQMEVENNRLSQQVAQLSAQVRSSRSTTPISNQATSPPVPAITESPTLTPTLFKQEGEELPMERIPFPTPATSALEYSPTLQPSTLAEASDATQHPAAVLCDLPCPSVASKAVAVEMEAAAATATATSTSATLAQRFHSSSSSLTMMLPLLFLTMTSVASSTVIQPLSQILHSLKTGLPLAVSTEEISRLFPLIHWLISTPSLSPSTSTRPVFRMRLLARLLACSPAMARPLRDATGRALQLAVSEQVSPETRLTDAPEGRPRWESLLTMAWAIERLQQRDMKMKSGRRRSYGKASGLRSWRTLARVGKQLG